jgi:hypothetical protein
VFAAPAAIASLVAFVLVSSAAPRSGSGFAAELSGVSALTSSNVWAAGDYFPDPSDIGDYKTVTEHLHGSAWSKVNSPSPSSYKAQLSGVAAVSASNVWAVGEYNARNGNDYTLIEHWSGSGWKIVKSPNPARFGNALIGVSAVSANNIWAVGYDGIPSTLVVHWNGHSWSKVGSPSPGGYYGSVLSAVSARAPNDVWAVGYYYAAGAGPRTLVEHWNGHSWSHVPSSNPSKTDDELTGVSAVGPNDVWAVGYETTASGDQTLIEHWNGGTWSKVPSLNPTSNSELAAVSGVSASDAWAVGATGVSSLRTLIARWNGGTWSKVKSPNPSSRGDQLLGVDARSSTDVWAVGYYVTSSGHSTLIEHWNGSTWSVR